MPNDVIVECSFLIPMTRDALLSDGQPHSSKEWEKLDDTLFAKFLGGTSAPGLYSGFYADPHTGQRVSDQSKKFIVAVPRFQLDELRQLLIEACDWFCQKCIYLSIAGNVEFIQKP